MENMDRIIKVGIAGFGRSGRDIHAKALSALPDKFKITAISDGIPERRKDAEKDFEAKTYEDYKQLLKNADYELFINALPSFLHPKATINAFKKGVHVVCDKPIATKTSVFNRILKASQDAQKKLLPFQNTRFQLVFSKITELISSGKFGKIINIRLNWSDFSRRWDWQIFKKNMGGNLLNTGSHPLDIAVVLFENIEPANVFCKMSCDNAFGGDADDFCQIILHGKNSPTIEVIISSYQAHPQGDMYFISGKYGCIAGNPTSLRWKYFDPQKAPNQNASSVWSEGNRLYCSEQLPWIEGKWDLDKDIHPFDSAVLNFYKNVYDVLTENAQQVVTLEQVKKQVEIIEKCHKQNPQFKF
jgi:predicted dehydrogenase